MIIISFVNQKGGVGKSTLAFNFASYLSKKNYDVLLIDTDAQKSLFKFLFKRDEFSFEDKKYKIPFKYKHLHRIEKLDIAYDYVIIDCAGFDGEEQRNIIKKSNKVIIPTITSQFDISATYDVVDILTELHILGYKPQNYILFNQVTYKLIDTDSYFKKVKEDLIDKPISIIPYYISDTVDYTNSVNKFQSIFEYPPSSPSGKRKELEKVIRYILFNEENGAK